MKQFLKIFLGVLTAIGGFVDIGDLVTNAQVGARLGMSLTWIILLGVVGIALFAEMSGRVVACSGRATFDIIRERLGPRVGLLNLIGSMAVSMLTFVAEIGGIALSLELITSVNEVILAPVLGVIVWFILWKAKFSMIENVLGLLGLALLVFVVALFKLGPDWGALATQFVAVQKPAQEHWTTWCYYAVAIFGSALTPYEVFFFSSGGVEEGWTKKSIGQMRANVLVGFPLGGLLSLSITACAAVVLLPLGVNVSTLAQTGLPVAVALGKIGLAIAILGFVAATLGAACETGLSTGYSIAQYFGWQWGKFVRPREAARFHLVIALATALAIAILLTGVDPVKVTEASVVFSAVALPLTYFPILVVANDRDYMGDQVNGKAINVLAMAFLVIVVVAAVAAIPLMIITGLGS